MERILDFDLCPGDEKDCENCPERYRCTRAQIEDDVDE